MKSKSGRVWVSIVIGVTALALVIAGYFIFRSPGPLIGPEQPVDPSSAATVTTTVSNEDGTHEGYIKRTFLEDDKKFIDIDYIQILTSKAAAIRKLQDGDCVPQEGWTKEQVIAAISTLEGSEDEIDLALHYVPGMGNCGPNGWWADVNDNPKVRTLQVALKEPITTAYQRDEFGPSEYVTWGPYNNYEGYQTSWETFEKIISEINYDTPFQVVVTSGMVVSIHEIYRP